MIDNHKIVVYENGEIALKIPIDSTNETIWLNQIQLSELFETSVDNISLHLKNIYKDEELDENLTIEYFSVVRKEGDRSVKRNLKHYDLDAIISLGYRINSSKATQFRRWATKVLKTYIQNGYTINSEKITVDRFVHLEKDIHILKTKVHQIDHLMTSNALELHQGIFYDGQIFDAYTFVNNLLKHAKKEVILIDNYIDDTTLTLLSKYPNLKYLLISKKISKQLKLDISKYQQQYNNLTIKTSHSFHDRFLLIDHNEAYHIGASLKDLGKKVFAFSKIEIKLLMDKIDE